MSTKSKLTFWQKQKLVPIGLRVLLYFLLGIIMLLGLAMVVGGVFSASKSEYVNYFDLLKELGAVLIMFVGGPFAVLVMVGNYALKKENASNALVNFLKSFELNKGEQVDYLHAPNNTWADRFGHLFSNLFTWHYKQIELLSQYKNNTAAVSVGSLYMHRVRKARGYFIFLVIEDNGTRLQWDENDNKELVLSRYIDLNNWKEYDLKDVTLSNNQLLLLLEHPRDFVVITKPEPLIRLFEEAVSHVRRA